ncbi:hypothetical protein [Chitinophaga qingshengii]|uniref:DUF1080 domain-containing protein n=1 Tax=Chitinophaga qingshengii TaxID=1569794 RepID=A0ABR7TNU5_9BACT|nr:hypothetical protein [Chitinophaga qingshengii]MBC9932151.1 hypothetical protein [Chitinophaga qingshengii]
MTRKIAGMVLLFFSMQVKAQSSGQIPLKAAHWEFAPDKVRFITHRDVPAMALTSVNSQAILKNLDFRDGTIEYDIEPVGDDFTAIYFRRADNKEKECFYFRTPRAGKPHAPQGVQYAPFLDEVNLWDLYYQFQGPADFDRNRWNHVKLIISGRQMRVFVNHQPVLEIPYLEGNTDHGGIAFDGQAYIANLVIKPGVTAGLSPVPGLDPTFSDARYLRKWLVSQPDSMPHEPDILRDFPSPKATWSPLIAERRGLVNLTRQFGKSVTPRLVWLKTTIQADSAQLKKISLGFSDDIWVYVNGAPVYADKNRFGTPMAKVPAGRCTLENTSFYLPLKTGNNELVIGVANNFFGWGLIARMDDIEGILLEY